MVDHIKEAFQKVKDDISLLKESIALISSELLELKKLSYEQPLNSRPNQQTNNQSSQQSKSPTHNPTHPPSNQTIQQETPTHNLTELNELPLKALKDPNNEFSTGNEGVPTNQPTNQQTNQHIFQHIRSENVGFRSNFEPPNNLENIDKISEILSSLDSIKKEVRFKFKKLTIQEMAVFTAIYQLEEKSFLPDYQLLAQTLNLSEISIRDYIRKLISKGIPIIKIKENNKKIILGINQDLKKITSLETIQMLREI